MSKKALFVGLLLLIGLSIVLLLRMKVGADVDVLVGPRMVTLHQDEDDVRFRGLYATDDTVVVVGGNKGLFGYSLDGGIHWDFQQLNDAPESQFRSVWAHDDHTFLAVSAGAPSYVYYSEDQGQSWIRTFEDTAQATFLDGIVFTNDSIGFIYGDPIDGYFKLLRTSDGGKSWSEIEGPSAIDGEVSFAASGSAITVGEDIMSIVTGGTVSRVHVSMDLIGGTTWNASPLELVQGLPSQGAFAQYWDKEKLFIVGGDYLDDHNTNGTVLVADLSTGEDDIKTMQKLASLPYTSDVSGDGQYLYFAGTTGVRYFDDELHLMDTTAMYSLVNSGKYVFVSGPKGKICRIFKGTVGEFNDLMNLIGTE